MSDNNSEFDQPIAGHDYDGIQEFDNPLPMWWLWTFFGTIIFSFIYYIHYEFNVGPTLDQELAADMASIQAIKEEAHAHAPEVNLADVLGDPAKIQLGAAAYMGKCASCHGDKGQGLIGPNLTDRHWVHGATPEAIYAVIAGGVLDKGMPPWQGILKDDEIQGLVAFIDSIKGSNPPGAKGPEGSEVPDYY